MIAVTRDRRRTGGDCRSRSVRGRTGKACRHVSPRTRKQTRNAQSEPAAKDQGAERDIKKQISSAAVAIGTVTEKRDDPVVVGITVDPKR